jgi:Cys-tRNA(Pro)/Cys-tRNA(Cys) deacylase
MKKTNAIRILDIHNVPYEIFEYAVDLSDLSGEHVADVLRVSADQVFKTLVLRGDKTGILVACLPSSLSLDLKSLASVSGNKKVEMVPMKDIFSLTGYVRGGCSPLGMQKKYPCFLEEQAFVFDSIWVSAGIRGMQVCLTPTDLVRLGDMQVVSLAS